MLKTFSGRRASQNEFELHSMIKLFKEHGVKNYLEIGARHGDTFHEVMKNLAPGSHGVALDLPGGLWGTHSSVDALEVACDDLTAHGYAIKSFLGDSTDQRTVDLVREFGPFDAILIDGDHTLKGVATDYRNYKGMGKIVCFHDIVGDGEYEKVSQQAVEVPKFWRETKILCQMAGQKIVEFVDKDSKMGIGCILI